MKTITAPTQESGRQNQMMLLQQPQQYALIIEAQTDMQGIPGVIGGGFMKIGKYIEKLGELPTDIPFVEYPVYGQQAESNIRMIVGFYTAKPLLGKDDIQSIVIPERKTVVYLYKGSYNDLTMVYNEMAAWIKRKGYEPTETSIEHYYTGPKVSESEQITKIVMPLK